MKKRIIAIILCAGIVFGGGLAYSPFTAIASPQFEVAPFWANVASITLTMSRSNGGINSTARVTGQAGTTSIRANFVLSRQNANGTFTTVDSWSASNGASPMILSTTRTTANQPVGTYWLSVTTTVTRNGTTETVSDHHSRTFQ